jgi:hypothetical protein
MSNKPIALLSIKYIVIPLNQFKTVGYPTENKKFWEELIPYFFDTAGTSLLSCYLAMMRGK